MTTSFNIFYEQELNQGLLQERVRQYINHEEETYLLNVNEADYIAHLTAKFEIDPLILDFDAIHASHHEQTVPAERFPRHFDVQPGEAYQRQVIRYHIPFSGDASLLKCKPSQHIMRTVSVFLEDDTLCFDLINFYDDPARIKTLAETKIGLIRRQYEYLSRDVESFNQMLKLVIQQSLTERRNRIMRQHQFVADLGVPLKRLATFLKRFPFPQPAKRFTWRDQQHLRHRIHLIRHWMTPCTTPYFRLSRTPAGFLSACRGRMPVRTRRPFVTTSFCSWNRTSNRPALQGKPLTSPVKQTS